MFINPLILYGIGLAAIPVILHFLMRAKPKKLMFPALQLLQLRKKTNSRRMNLKHIWLLILRVAVIALLILAFMRPSLPAAGYGMNRTETVTLIAIIALAVGAYFAATWYWKKQRMPHHLYIYRRTLLRYGSGLAACLLFLLLVVWPYGNRLFAELTAPDHQVADDLPVAGLFLFDTSPSMEYRQENTTRLEQAKAIALKHLDMLPGGSRIAIADTSHDEPIYFPADLRGANTRIEKLKTSPVVVPLNIRIKQAVAMQEQHIKQTLSLQESVTEADRHDTYLRAVYIFTDLATHAWDTGNQRELRTFLAKYPRTQIYIIDVGVDQPTNKAVVSLLLSKNTVSAGSGLVVRATISHAGISDAECTAELSLLNKAGDLIKQDQRTEKIKSGEELNIPFSAEGLNIPFAQGEVRLISDDPLSVDDVRYFTVRVLPPPRILVVAETRGETDEWIAALSPEELIKTKRARYRCSYLQSDKLENAELTAYQAVCLLNVKQLSSSGWDKLNQFVTSGGGLFIALGNNAIDPVSYNSAGAKLLLPGELLAHLKFSPPEYMDLTRLQHPLFSRFKQFGGVDPLTATDIVRYWKVKPNRAGNVIANYSAPRKTAALLENVHGQGRVVMLTTAVTSNGWNGLTLSGWSYPALADQMMQYLGRQLHGELNFTAGESVSLTINSEKYFTNYLLRTPGLQQLPGKLKIASKFVTLSDINSIGHYELIADEEQNDFATGFSVNIAEEETRLTRFVKDDSGLYLQLDKLLGEKRYQVSESIEQLEINVTAGRLGQEMFPYVIAIMLLFFCGEHLVANYFYEEPVKET